MEGVREREWTRFEIEDFFFGGSENIADAVGGGEEIIFVSR